jgi:hypothetical protein
MHEAPLEVKAHKAAYCEGQYESNASSFFSENVTAITTKFTWMIHTSLTVMSLFFHIDHKHT